MITLTVRIFGYRRENNQTMAFKLKDSQENTIEIVNCHLLSLPNFYPFPYYGFGLSQYLGNVKYTASDDNTEHEAKCVLHIANLDAGTLDIPDEAYLQIVNKHSKR